MSKMSRNKGKVWERKDFGKCGIDDCRAASHQVNHGYCWKCRKIIKAVEDAKNRS